MGIYHEVEFPRGTPRGRGKPYVLLNMVQSVDGKASIQGKASGLGTDADRGAMRTLRSRVDAVMVGGGTLRAEKLSLSLDAEDTRQIPRAVVMTNTGDLPLDKNLVRDPRQDVLVLLPEGAGKDAEKRMSSVAVSSRRVPQTAYGAIDVVRALEILKSDYGVEVLLCEGGPTLSRSLIEANLVDELFLTVAPVLVGTPNPEEPASSPLHGPSRSLRLISTHVAGDELFVRYALQSGR